MTEWLLADEVWWPPGDPAATAAARQTAATAAARQTAATSGVALRVADGVVTPVPDDSVPAGAPCRRVPGTLLPGLRDAHVHSALIDLATLRAGGIAAVWDLGGVPERVAELAGRPGLPHIRFAGPFLAAPGGYPGDRAWAPRGSVREVRSAADAAEAVAEARAGGATLVKVTAHAGGPLLPAGTLHALVGAAHAAGLPVVVHAEGPGTVAAAVDAGADLLAHTPWTEALDDGLTRAAAERTTWISTVDIHGYGRSTPERATAIGNLRRFLGYGGRVRYGTDLGNGPLPLAVNPREIRALQEAGLSPTDILTTMTDPQPGAEPGWIPGGLDLDPTRFADVLATARVLGPEVRPRRNT